MSRKLRIIVGVAAATSVLAIVPSAMAAPALTLSTAADPAESITTQIVASGTSSDKQTELAVTLKPTGAQACGANYQADASAGGVTVYFGESDVAEGPFSQSTNHTFDDAGSYLLCGWLIDDSQAGNPTVATASLTVAVRPPHLSLSVAAPTSVAVGQTFQLVTTAQAEVERSVEVFVIPDTGRNCPANASAAGTTAGVLSVDFPAHSFSSSWRVIGGPFSETVNETLKSAGQYFVCGYVQHSSDQNPPEITAIATITAVAPAPPCVVPDYSTSTKLKTAEQAIRASGCAVGKVRRIPSRRVRTGYVISFSTRAGTHLSPGAPINVNVSTGPPCVVPHVSAGTTLGFAEHRLLANHCAIGTIGSARSRRYRRGRVLRLGARSGQVLASHAAITITIARRH
ncbi:MAG TPA: PASTA domain-containing protein [Solirubrobacteraceae bacterium]